MINIIAKKHKNNILKIILKKIHNGGIMVPIKAPADGNTSRVITFERQIKFPSNLVKVSTVSQRTI